MDADRHTASATARSADVRTRRATSPLTVLQVLVALWLLVSPFVLEGPSALAAAKDLLAGLLLLVVTLAAIVSERARRLEPAVCMAIGTALIVLSLALEFGPGREAFLRQWNEVIVGVFLICMGAGRSR